MVKITIDGKSVQAKEGSSILENIRNLGIDMPTLCSHLELTPFGACRLCVVEVKTNGKWNLAASCEVPVEEGMDVKTTSGKAVDSRKLAAQLLSYKYPTTQAVIDIAQKLGVAAPQSAVEGHDCILCGLCTRTCREIVGVCALNFQDRGLGRSQDEPKIEFISANCIGCGSCAFACPTGFVKMETLENKRIIWNKVFKMVACNVCGRYFAPEDQLKYISKKTGVPIKELTVCTDCR